jgi:5-methylcytosine-specific restriction enzyme subunit McrC
VLCGGTLSWQIEQKTSGIDKILPTMRTDVVLDHPSTGRRIVIDTKFTSILTSGWYREETLRSGYVYQIYAYLRSRLGAAMRLRIAPVDCCCIQRSARRSTRQS